MSNRGPRVPVYPPAAAQLAQELSRIIDAGGEQATVAYAILSRLAILWAAENPETKVIAGYCFKHEKLDLSKNSQVIQGIIKLMSTLFPNGEGLPDADDCSCHPL